MTDQQGSDAQLTSTQAAEIRRRADLDLAAAVEEDRRTAAAPADGPG